MTGGLEVRAPRSRMRYCRACHRCFGDGVEFCLFDQTATREVATLPLIVEGKYRLEQLIAHGGMGSVYRATHLSLERAVAIKILRSELLSDATARERFNREARAAARLKHPNIVSVYDSGHLPNGSAYLVMELIEGRSLREEMNAHAARLGQMRPERAAAILAQVCAGLEAAHRLGIIHRDIKPDNVMIEVTADGTERVLVLDFGIAKLAVPDLSDLSKSSEQTWKGLTDENTIVGTPKYISPEQCTGQAVDARSDVYSLGVLLYEMLTGHAPFAGENTSIVLLKHLQEPPAPLRRFASGVNPQLEQVVLRALAKQPQQRFASAAEFAEQLLTAVSSRSSEPVAEPEENTMTAPRPAAARPVQFNFNDSPDDSSDGSSMDETKAPTLLIERRPRHKMLASVAVVLLVAVSALGYFLYNDWQASADEAQPVAASSPTLDVLPKPADKLATETKNSNAVPAAFVKPEVEKAESLQRELRAVYADWALAAVKGDWAKHASFYADRVEYFRDGSMPRAKVEARKRAIFGKLDSYWLKFSDSPQIVLKNDAEADLTFDRSWTLRRGRKQTSGRAHGSITLRRETNDWRIVSEKQIKQSKT
ncbi:MAG: protein kinase domain-containing protein [Blastocatellia bacterium]